MINDVTIDAINFGSVQAEREFLVSIGSHTEYTLAVVHTVAIPTGGTVEIVTTSDSLIILHNGRELRRFGLPENPTVSIWGSDLDDNVEIRPNDTGSQVDIRFDAGAGNDTVALIGGSLLRKGDLDIFGGSGNDTIDLSRGTAIRAFARGDDGNDTLIGSDNADLLTGDAGDDVIRGGAGNDILSGDSRGGLFTGIPGDDTIDGGEGIDTVFASGDVDFWLDNEKLVGHGTDQLTSIESAWIIGGPSANLIRTHRFVSTAGRGVIVNGAGGDDSISGGRFDDAIRGGDGNDLIYGLHGNDVLSGEAGNDTLLGGSNGDLILGNGGNDVAVGGLATTPFAAEREMNCCWDAVEMISSTDKLETTQSSVAEGTIQYLIRKARTSSTAARGMTSFPTEEPSETHLWEELVLTSFKVTPAT